MRYLVKHGTMCHGPNRTETPAGSEFEADPSSVALALSLGVIENLGAGGHTARSDPRPEITTPEDEPSAGDPRKSRK